VTKNTARRGSFEHRRKCLDFGHVLKFDCFEVSTKPPSICKGVQRWNHLRELNFCTSIQIYFAVKMSVAVSHDLGTLEK